MQSLNESNQFKQIQRVFSEDDGRVTARVLPGQYYVTDNDEIISTVLGSCIAACICDPVRGVGGMNHFMLPKAELEGSRWRDSSASADCRYGDVAMGCLIKEVLRRGGLRERLQVKIFGGGKILSSLTDVGRQNIEFVKAYLMAEKLEIAALDVGDCFPRKINFYPASGKVWVKKLNVLHSHDIGLKEQELIKDIK